MSINFASVMGTEFFSRHIFGICFWVKNASFGVSCCKICFYLRLCFQSLREDHGRVIGSCRNFRVLCANNFWLKCNCDSPFLCYSNIICTDICHGCMQGLSWKCGTFCFVWLPSLRLLRLVTSKESGHNYSTHWKLRLQICKHSKRRLHSYVHGTSCSRIRCTMSGEICSLLKRRRKCLK